MTFHYQPMVGLPETEFSLGSDFLLNYFYDRYGKKGESRRCSLIADAVEVPLKRKRYTYSTKCLTEQIRPPRPRSRCASEPDLSFSRQVCSPTKSLYNERSSRAKSPVKSLHNVRSSRAKSPPKSLHNERSSRAKSPAKSLHNVRLSQVKSSTKSLHNDRSSRARSRKPSDVSSAVIHLNPQTASLSEQDGPVLYAASFLGTLVAVQESKVLFWTQKTLEESIPLWTESGTLTRVNYEEGILLNVDTRGIKKGIDIGVLYGELWKCTDYQTKIISLKASLFYCSITTEHTEHNIIELENNVGEVTSARMCIIDDISLLVCYSVTEEPGNGYARKYNLNLKMDGVFKILKYTYTHFPVTYLSCIGGDNQRVLAWNGAIAFLWYAKKESDWISLRLNHPTCDDKGKKSKLEYAVIKTGLLFTLFSDEKNLEFASVDVKTCCRRIICNFSIPETYDGLVGVVLVKDKLVAAFKNGIVCWGLDTYSIVAESMFKEVKGIFMGIEEVIIVKSPSAIYTFTFEQCTKHLTI